jgi:putative membrane protein
MERSMKRSLLFSSVLLIPVALSLNAAASPPDQPGHQSPAPGTTNNTVSAVKDATGHAVGLVSAEMTSTLKGFAGEAATSDMYEVAAAKVALDRSKNADVRAFATEMVSAHTATSEKLKSLLASHKDVGLPSAVDDRRQGMLDELRGAKAEDFDGRYISQQVYAHQEALLLMQGYAKSGDDKSVKAFAHQTEKAVQTHLNMAHKLDDQLARKS